MNKITFTKVKADSAFIQAENPEHIYVSKDNVLFYLVESNKGPIQIHNGRGKVIAVLPRHVVHADYVLTVQQVKPDRWMLLHYDEEKETNVICVFSCEGEVMKEFSVGEGIADCQVDDVHQIWISYFDEGIFSGFEMSRSDLVALDIDGNIIFDYGDIVNVHNLPSIDDCYGMNVLGDEIWLYYYSEFPVVQLKNNHLHNWWPDTNLGDYLSGGFAVWDNVLLFEAAEQELMTYSLQTKEFSSAIAVDEQGNRLDFWDCFYKGASIYLRTDEGVYRFTPNEAE
ncbi:hypothetical protein QNH32_05190 [Priestia flexa]|uniref:hypothetical protein n=1 Tax=Priestia flexa TaxID=86664 RepID=UPI0024C08F86|nr:hypothetical protein [Priestia flexa]WHX80005.1 hypothetical protein QNH32_05190 [Priestia flexa]